MKFANNLFTLRNSRGLSQDYLAQRLNVSKQTISDWENGVSEPNLSTLVDIAKFFYVSLDELLKWNIKIIIKYPKEIEKDTIRIVEMAGYDISDILIKFQGPADLEKNILYTSKFDGIISYESPFYYGIKPSSDHESLKRLFFKISMQPNDDLDWYMITDQSPENMQPFYDWLREHYDEIGNIENLYVFYEKNPDYDYKLDYDEITVCFPNEDIDEQLGYLKEYMLMQEYDGPFPPIILYQKIKEERPDVDLPKWFMTGNFVE